LFVVVAVLCIVSLRLAIGVSIVSGRTIPALGVAVVITTRIRRGLSALSLASGVTPSGSTPAALALLDDDAVAKATTGNKRREAQVPCGPTGACDASG